MKQLDFNSATLTNLFREIGLYSPKNQFYSERARKYQQVFAYISQLKSAFNKLSTKRPLVLIDCGCGKSYLSFILYEYCKSVLARDIKIIGVDNNPELITKCQQTAQDLNFENMEFNCAAVENFATTEKVDVVYSLHACDTATDQTIAAGIKCESKYIFSVSCCQHTNRNKIEKHPLGKVTCHQPYKERLVDMLGDSMRALLLQHRGYGVNVFEFIAAEYTPKNIMLRAIKGAVKKAEQEPALANYRQLVEMFHFAPALEKFI